MVWETNRTLTLCSFCLRLVFAFTPIANLLIFKRILNAAVQGSRHEGFDPHRIWMLLAISLAISLLSGGASRLIALSDSLLGDRFAHYLSLRIMKHAASLDMIFFEDPVFYDKLDRARRQTSSRLGMLTAVAAIFRQSLTLISMVVVVALYSRWLLLLLVLGAVPVFLNESKFAILNYSILFRRTPVRRKLDYLRFLGSSSQGAKEVKIFGLGNHLAQRLGALFEDLYAENRHLAVRRTIYGAIFSLLSVASNYGAYVYILFRTLAGAVTVGDMGLCAGAFFRAGDLMQDLVTRVADSSEQALHVKDLFDFLETKPKIVSLQGASPAPQPIRHGFEFQNVSFSYPGSAVPVLRHVSFRLAAGERIAIVGENGAGKTTLVKLLARLYDPTEGRILLDGVDLREYDVDDLRRQIGVIFQDYLKYELKAAENIGFGRIEDLDNVSRIRESAEKSLASEIIQGFPQGYEQVLGRRFEGGLDLSIGQWQKIALARSYMRDGQILVLDEPTANLDARAEFEVYERFAALTHGKTAILISHRFSTVRVADRILVLSHGNIVEEGSHNQLISLGGKYAELFQFQAARYR
jgi:ATP-binding cassette subfamily B protein